MNLPHGVWIDRRGRLLVADRENDRVQIFDQNGKLLTIWSTELIGPAFFYLDDDDIVYIPEHDGGMVSILTLDGERLARWGTARSTAPATGSGSTRTSTSTSCSRASGDACAASSNTSGL